MTEKKGASRDIAELKRRSKELAHLSSAIAILSWDQEVHMPKKGAEARAASIAYLAATLHNHFLEIDADGLLSRLKKDLDAKALKGKNAGLVAEIWRSFDRQRKLPEAFVREFAETSSRSQHVWADARSKNDFAMFLPWLERIVKLKRQEAEYVGYRHSPYDALLEEFEPGMTTEEASRILNDLKDFMVPFIERIRASKQRVNYTRVLGQFPIREQQQFNELVAQKMGFDFDAGRVDVSAHPFATAFHPHDVRITTRYKENDMLYALGSTIHETGHALYEQGLPHEQYGTPLAEAISYSIHESQSRMWENMIGKSKPFWRHLYPKLQKAFPKPFKDIPANEFYAILNQVQPSLIRTDADEVTYNMHIILRFEIEREMIEGSVALKDLPEIWRSKMKETLGVTVPNDTQGVLQDVHWSMGYIGYFPTYSFGNLYAAQFYNALEKSIPDVTKQYARGEFAPTREWLRTHIHQHGKTYTASQLVRKVTGEPLSSRYFNEYLEKKYSELYNL